jgi:hypothetical protein
MAAADLYAVRDGETLQKLDKGLEIVRRKKHEWMPSLETLPQDTLIRRTGKVWGSKFYRDWTLPALVTFIRTAIDEGWTLQPGQASETDRLFDYNIGLVAGIATKIKVICDGRYVHAYPAAE